MCVESFARWREKLKPIRACYDLSMSMGGEPPGNGDKKPPHLRVVEAYRPRLLPENLDETTVNDARRTMQLIYTITMPRTENPLDNPEKISPAQDAGMTPARWLHDPAEKLLKDKAFWDRVTGKGINPETRERLLKLKNILGDSLNALYEGKAIPHDERLWEELDPPGINTTFGPLGSLHADVRAARKLERKITPAEIQARAWIIGLDASTSEALKQYSRDERLKQMRSHIPELRNLLKDLQDVQKILYREGTDLEVVQELEVRFEAVKEQMKDRLKRFFNFDDENLSRLDRE